MLKLHLLFIIIKLFEVKEVKNEFFDWKCIFFQSHNTNKNIIGLIKRVYLLLLVYLLLQFVVKELF